mgnify:CR=1 FL=1
MPRSVPTAIFHTGIDVSPAAYETRSDDVTGLMRRRRITQMAFLLRSVSYRSSESVEKKRSA